MFKYDPARGYEVAVANASAFVISAMRCLHFLPELGAAVASTSGNIASLRLLLPFLTTFTKYALGLLVCVRRG